MHPRNVSTRICPGVGKPRPSLVEHTVGNGVQVSLLHRDKGVVCAVAQLLWARRPVALVPPSSVLYLVPSLTDVPCCTRMKYTDAA